MEAYATRVNQLGPVTSLPFLEEFFSELRREAEATRADDQLYIASLTKGNEGLALMLLMHEIGHVALGHSDHPSSDAKVQIFREGEADGFASYMAALGDQGPMGQASSALARHR